MAEYAPLITIILAAGTALAVYIVTRLVSARAMKRRTRHLLNESVRQMAQDKVFEKSDQDLDYLSSKS